MVEKKYLKKFGLTGFVFLCFCLQVFSLSIISGDYEKQEKVTINCLGENNLLSLYEDNRLIYSRKCDGEEKIYSNYLKQTNKIIVKNSPDSENERIDYIEYLNTIQDEKIKIKFDRFENNYCFNIILNKYSDIKILGFNKTNVRDFYHCFNKKYVENFDKSNSESLSIPIFINGQIKEEFVINKSTPNLNIQFEDLGIVDEKNKDKINVIVTTPLDKELKVSLVDTNLNCNVKNFVLSEKYKFYCNKTKEVPFYFVQLKDSEKKISFQEYQIPPKFKKQNSNKSLIIVFVICALMLLFFIYSSKSKSKDKTAIDQLENLGDDE